MPSSYSTVGVIKTGCKLASSVLWMQLPALCDLCAILLWVQGCADKFLHVSISLLSATLNLGPIGPYRPPPTKPSRYFFSPPCSYGTGMVEIISYEGFCRMQNAWVTIHSLHLQIFQVFCQHGIHANTASVAFLSPNPPLPSVSVHMSYMSDPLGEGGRCDPLFGQWTMLGGKWMREG